MFAKSDKPAEQKSSNPVPEAPPKVDRSNQAPSIISADLEITGNLKSAGDIQIDGRVKGDVHSRSVTISENALIEGSIFGETVKISGTIRGQVEAPSVAIQKSAHVMGDIIHGTLAIESGARFEGACRRLEKQTSAGTGKGPGEPTKAA